jgi:hypothetical protein
MKKVYSKLAMTAVGTFIVGGAAIADAPYPWDAYSATAGVITLDTGAGLCGDAGAGGFACSTMESTGQGIHQGLITSNDTGVSYLQQIVVENDATGVAAALPFTQETYAFASGISSNNVAIKQHQVDQGQNLTVYVQENAFESGADISDPNSNGDGVHLNIDQVIDLAAGGDTLDYQQFKQDGQNGSDRQTIKTWLNSGNITFGQVTVDGAFAPTTSGTLGGVSMEGTVNYAAGEALRATVLGNDQSSDQDFMAMHFLNLDTGEKSLTESIDLEGEPGTTGWGETSDSYGFGVVAAGQLYDWDANATAIFGVTPTDNGSNPPTLD